MVVGTRIRVGAATFEAGRDGDRVVVDDWDCDGLPTPAVVRPDTGEVFVFDRWDGGGDPLTITPVTVVAGATDIAPGPGRGCTGAVVRRTAGTPAVLDAVELAGASS